MCGMADHTGKKWVVLKVFNAILSEPVLPAADEAPDQILGVFRHIGDLLWKLKAFLHNNGRVRGMGGVCVIIQNLMTNVQKLTENLLKKSPKQF